MARPSFRSTSARHALRMLVANLVGAATLMVVSTRAHANPQGGQVAAGSASIAHPSSNHVAITQTSEKAVINWQSFSIGAGERTTFTQPNAQAIVLNRVVGTDPSKILGNLSANGQVWLVNPNGVVFGKTAQVDVAGLLATTLDISDRDFMAGNYKFREHGKSGAMVVNAGHITVKDTGLAALVAPGAENAGVIAARLGKIQLASASGFTVDLNGDGTFNFLLDKQVTQKILHGDGTTASAAITNTGSLIADGGIVLLTADAAKSVVDNVIDMQGYVQARSVSTRGGTIVLDGGTEGVVRVSGALDASGQGVDQNGGTIKVLGGMKEGTVNVSGKLDAAAPNGGNGGFIETSAAHVALTDTANVTTAAPGGKTGTWVIDPNDYTIAATGGDISGSALSTQLANNNVSILSSAGAGGVNGDINVNDTVNWSTNTLTLTAANNINVNAVMTASGNASLALNPATTNGADVGVGGGTVLMGMHLGNFTGRVDFTGAGTLSINGTPYTVINSLGVAGDTSGTTLQGMNGNVAGHYALGSSIDASATSTWNGGAGFSPIGFKLGASGCCLNNSLDFIGVFDGLGHSISGLVVTNTNTNANAISLGLFSVLGPSGTARNLNIANGSINVGPGSQGGLLAGFARIASVNSVAVSGSVIGSGAYSLGGLIGTTSGGTTNNASASVTVSDPVGGGVGGGYFGGLVGAASGQIISSHADGVVSGGKGSQLGGLVGNENFGALIRNSYSTANVTGRDNAIVGGLVGLSGGSIESSYATGTVSAGNNSQVGGLAGMLTCTCAAPFYRGTVTSSYAMGPVTGGNGSYVGGIVGWNAGGLISSSYETSALAGGSGSYVGGTVGRNENYQNVIYGTVENSYWNSETSGAVNGTGFALSYVSWEAGTRLTTAQLKTGLPTGFDSAVWALNSAVNNGYPSLQWQVASASTPAPTPTPTPTPAPTPTPTPSPTPTPTPPPPATSSPSSPSRVSSNPDAATVGTDTTIVSQAIDALNMLGVIINGFTEGFNTPIEPSASDAIIGLGETTLTQAPELTKTEIAQKAAREQAIQNVVATLPETPSEKDIQLAVDMVMPTYSTLGGAMHGVTQGREQMRALVRQKILDSCGPRCAGL